MSLNLRQTLRRWTTSTGIGGPIHRNKQGNSNTTGTAQASGNYGTYQGTTNTSQTAVYRVYETFIIEGETYAYVSQERLRWKWSKPANLIGADLAPLQ